MFATISPVKDFIGDEQGSYTVEFVVLVPLLLAALVFSFEFARAFWAYDVMTRDVRAGLRYLSRSSGSCGTSAETRAESVAETGLINGTDANAHFPWKGASPTFTCTTTPYSIANFGQNGTVINLTANVPVSFSFTSFFNSVTGAALATSYTLVVSDQARYIGD